MLNVYEQHSRRKLIATILAVVVIAGAVVFADHFKEANEADKSQTAQTSASTTPSEDTATNSTSTAPTTDSTSTTGVAYKDGSYSASSSYYVPHGNETIDVNLTLQDGVITDVSIQNSEGDRESAEYQEDFASVYKSYVVGKKIDGLRLGNVAGASDTTEGFDNAISQIASKALA